MKAPAKPRDWSALDLEYSIYSLDRAAARELLATMTSLQAPWKNLQTLLREKKARFEHLVSLKAKSGQRAVAEEIREVRYVSEYQPAARPTVAEKTERTAIIPGYPSAFETRNAGVTIEVEPVVGPDGLSIDLNHVGQSVTHLGDLKTTGVAARYPAQPLFEKRIFTTSQTILAGQQTLVSTFNPPGANGVNDRADSGRTWLVFVRATPNEP